jgi:DNA-binding transcriptional regulator LsrR (DeoR family)
MNSLSSSMNSIEWPRTKVLEFASQGYNQLAISRILQISQPTINRDLAYLRQQVKENIKRYIDERLPEEYEKCLVRLNTITRKAWNTAQNIEDRIEKIQAFIG